MMIPLTNGGFVVVDDADAEWALAFRWRATRWTGSTPVYAVRSEGRRTVLMHRELIDAAPGIVVDHVNRIGLDNRRSNLRLCTASENARNTRRLTASNKSGFRGIGITHGGLWQARIRAGGKRVNLGCFSDPVEAARAYDKAAAELHGDFATLNFAGGQP